MISRLGTTRRNRQDLAACRRMSRTFYLGLPSEPIVNHVAVTKKAAIETPVGHFDTYVIEWSRSAANCGAILDEVNRCFYVRSLGAVLSRPKIMPSSRCRAACPTLPGFTLENLFYL